MVRKTYKVHDIDITQANDPSKEISKTVYEAEDHHAEDGMIGFESPDATLVSNVLTPVDSLVVVRGQGGSDDTIDHISFSAVPDIADKDLLWLAQGAEAITITHNAGSPPANSGPILLLSQIDKKMIGTRMVLLQRQGSNFQEIAYDGIVGNGGILVTDDNGNAIIVCGSVPSADNHLKITNAISANDVVIEVVGSGSDIGLEIKGKGTKFVQILSLIVTTLLDANSLAWGKVNSIVSAVNELTFSNAATGDDPIIEGTGGDADVGINLKTKGTGVITAINTKITNIRESTGSALALIITGAASIVNHFEIKPSITTEDLELNALGDDTNIGIKITPQGSGRVTILEQIVTNIREATGGAIAIAITAIASAVNFIEVKANVTTSDPEIEAKGSDTNVGILFVPQAAGLIRGNIETILLPLGDESTPPTVADVKYTFYMQRAGKFVGAGFANATVAPTTDALILDIHLNGTTIFSTLPEVAATQNEGSNGVLTINPTTFAAGDKIELLIDTIDSGATGAGAKVGISIYYT